LSDEKRRRGRPAKPIEDHKREGTFRKHRHEERARIELYPGLVDEFPLAPRRRLLLGDDVEERTDGPWLARFCETFCVQKVGRFNGLPLVLEPWQRAFFDDALAFDDDGRRLYTTALLGIPRKNGKTTMCAGAGLALASPYEGEGKPLVIISAGSLTQAGELFDVATDFVRGDDDHRTLSLLFEPQKIFIRCEANGGVLRRVSGDGKLNHSLNIYALLADELHAWVTPKQVENWAALTTASGARDDAIAWAITTAGFDPNSILGELFKVAWESPLKEMRPEMGDAGFVVRDPEAELLVHWYGVKSGTALDDVEAFARANPASWRTAERLEKDLRKKVPDEPNKRRLYGNEWTGAKERWISPSAWEAAKRDALPPETEVYYGVDVGLTGDSTAVAWAWRTEDEKIAVRAKVWSADDDVKHHVFVPGGTVDLAAVETFVFEKLREVGGEELAYDPRFFERSAQLIDDEADLAIFPLWQNSQQMADAYQSFYDAVERDGLVIHDGDPIFAAHVAAAAGIKTERGWKVSKLKSTNKIDALVAAVMAVYRAIQGEGAVDFVSWDDLDEDEDE
jgi:phage terminase large subunit-like protein